MLSGARVATLEEDWQLMEAAAKTPGRGNAPAPLVPKRDMVIKEGDTVTLGNTSLKVYKLPGHTAGSPSFEFTVFDGGRPHKAFLFGVRVPQRVRRGAVLASANAWRRSRHRVAVPVHTANDFHTRTAASSSARKRLMQRKPGQPHPFVDAAAWQTWVKEVQVGAAKNRRTRSEGGADPIDVNSQPQLPPNATSQLVTGSWKWEWSGDHGMREARRRDIDHVPTLKV